MRNMQMMDFKHIRKPVKTVFNILELPFWQQKADFRTAGLIAVVLAAVILPPLIEKIEIPAKVVLKDGNSNPVEVQGVLTIGGLFPPIDQQYLTKGK